MIDLLAAVQSVDPLALPVWVVLLFSLGMYPVGIMLGAECSDCCSPQPCSECEEGKLPDTVTVTFDGIPDKTHSQDYITLGFSSCFGSGASARVLSPGGDPDTDKGPIGDVSVVSGGSGYAQLGRVEPTVTASASGSASGTGATFSVTLAQSQDECGRDKWSVDSVSMSGGSGYAEGDAVTFSVAEGDTEAQAAAATLRVPRTQPTLTLSGSGTGAAFDINYTHNGTPPDDTWAISSVDVNDGGSGYTHNSQATVNLGTDDFQSSAATLTIRNVLAEPTLSASVSTQWYQGRGATFGTPVMYQFTPPEYWLTKEPTLWGIQSLSVTTPGVGYYAGVVLEISLIDGVEARPAWIRVTAVDENGGITAVAPYEGWQGGYYKDTGVISSIRVDTGGAFYKADSSASIVQLTSGGTYWREDTNADPYVADITVSISQIQASTGTGASLRATVDSNTQSETFGQVTGIAVENGGDGYLAWKWVANDCYGHWINGKAVVLRRDKADPCTYLHALCGGWPQQTQYGFMATYDANMNGTSAPIAGAQTAQSTLVVQYRGPSTPPRAWISLQYSEQPDAHGSHDPAYTNGAFVVDSDSPIANCDDFGFTATNPDGVSVTVTSGGGYDREHRNPTDSQSPTWPCSSCCQGDGLSPSEVTVDLEAGADFAPQALEGDFSGTYVLSRFTSPQSWRFSKQLPNYYWGDLCSYWLTIQVSVIPGVCPTTDDWWQCGVAGVSCPGCDQCIKKCQTIASVSIEESCAGGGDYVYLADHGGLAPASWLECGACDSTPVCAPKQMSVNFATIRNQPFTQYLFTYYGDFCTLTIN